MLRNATQTKHEQSKYAELHFTHWQLRLPDFARSSHSGPTLAFKKSGTTPSPFKHLLFGSSGLCTYSCLKSSTSRHQEVSSSQLPKMPTISRIYYGPKIALVRQFQKISRDICCASHCWVSRLAQPTACASAAPGTPW